MKELTVCNSWMFKKVSCSSYMKKVNDGRFINKDNVGNCEYVETSRIVNGECWTEPVSEEDYDGTKHFLKTYRKRVDADFTGVVVGMKMVLTTAYLVCDTEYHYDGSEYTVVRKEPEESIKCALVYYGCNRSRLVPLDAMEIIGGVE